MPARGSVHRRFLRYLPASLLLAAWLVCGMRAIAFLIRTRALYEEDRAIHSWNDYAFGRWIVVCYFICAGLGFGAMALGSRGRRALVRIPMLASMISGVCLAWIRPEEVVVHAPSAAPGWATAFCVSSALLAAATAGLLRFRSSVRRS